MCTSVESPVYTSKHPIKEVSKEVTLGLKGGGWTANLAYTIALHLKPPAIAVATNTEFVLGQMTQ